MRLSLFAIQAGFWATMNLSVLGDEPAPTRDVLYLERSESPHGEQNAHGGRLYEEIFRQGLLIAARDELGIPTRDTAIGETATSTTSNNRPLVLTVTNSDRDGEDVEFTINIFDLIESESTPIRSLRFTAEWRELDYEAAVERADIWSVAEFVELLKERGFKPANRPERSEATLPADVTQRIEQMSFLSQFDAVREIHALIREHGPSDELLAGLSRSYAQLGELCSYHWNDAHKVYRARSLLYAQRLKRTTQSVEFSTVHRALALALCGRHFAAFVEGKRFENPVDTVDSSKLPGWSRLIGPFVEFKPFALRDAAKNCPEHGELAILLTFLAVEPSGGDRQRLQLIDEMLAQRPTCFRFIAKLHELGMLDSIRRGAGIWFPTLVDGLPAYLRGLKGLPNRVTARISKEEPLDREGLSDLIELLMNPESSQRDMREPTCAALGQLINEMVFAHTYLQLSFLKNSLGVPVDEEVRTVAPLVKHHRYHAFIEGYGIDPGRYNNLQRDLINDMVISESNLRLWPIMNFLFMVDKEKRTALWRAAMDNHDAIVPDVVAYLNQANIERRLAKSYNMLFKISPFHPIQLTDSVREAWDHHRSGAAEMIENAAGHPKLLAAIADQLISDEDFDLARNSLERAIEASPDYWLHIKLAEMEKDLGDVEAWRSVLEQFLELEVHGLDHTNVRTMIAEQYMSDRKWNLALPWAKQAAESGQSKAMMCAARCAEGLGLWPDAESWVKRNAERYEPNRIFWYSWCKRTGRGDIDEAEKLARIDLVSRLSSGSPMDNYIRGVVARLDGDKSQAADHLARAASQGGGSTYALLAAAFAFELGDTENRNQRLSDAIKHVEQLSRVRPNKELERRVQIAQWALSLKPDSDNKELSEILEASDEKAFLDMVVGYMLDGAGQTNLARTHLLRSARSSDLDEFSRSLATVKLIENGMTRDQIQESNDPAPQEK